MDICVLIYDYLEEQNRDYTNGINKYYDMELESYHIERWKYLRMMMIKKDKGWI